MARHNGKIILPNLRESIDKIISEDGKTGTEVAVRNRIPFHKDIYDTVHAGIDAYMEAGDKKASNDFKRTLYEAVRDSITDILHAQAGLVQNPLEKFKKDSLKAQHRNTMGARLDYVDSLVVAAFRSTEYDKGIGFRYRDMVDWRYAVKAMRSAMSAYDKTKKPSDPRVVANLAKAHETFEVIRAAAHEAYDSQIGGK